MAQTNTSESESEFSRIRIRNFEGLIDFTEDFLKLSFTEFQRREPSAATLPTPS